jgi:sugar phosphate isomerase/epimerase
MQRILSTYRYIDQKLTATELGAIAQAGFKAVEVYCRANHFNYRNPQTIRELAAALNEYRLELHSLHAPAESEGSARNDGGVPISISDTERIRRLDAVDELKRALEVAETAPFKYFVQHLGYGRQSADERKFDAAFTSLEHLVVFAKARGVTIALENTPDELGAPSSLQRFITQTHLNDLRLCFDIGHAHMEDGAVASFEVMRDRIVTAHIHDNNGEKDEHLLPFAGTIDWNAALGEFAKAKELPGMVLEIKEQAGGAPTLDEIRAVCDKVEDKVGR